jgi:hypothetical protein
VFVVAAELLDAAERHLEGDFAGAGASLLRANNKDVWRYTDQSWGKGAAARYGFLKMDDAPPRLALADRPAP